MAAAAILTGCQNDDIIEGGGSNDNLKMVEITAGMPGNDGSRTAFIDGGVKWQANDALSVFVGEQNYKFTIEDGIGENEATFLGEVPASADFTNNVAYYPYGENVSIAQAEGKYTVSAQYPVVQQWAADGSFGPNSLPMIAQNGTQNSDKYNFNFKTLGGWLQLYVKGDATITKVVMKAAKGQKIAGDYTVTVANGASPVMEMAETAVRYVALDCGEGVQLSNEKATLFTFAVAPFTFAAGEVSFDLYDNTGKFMPNAYTITKAGTIIANAYYTLAMKSPVDYKGIEPVAKIGEMAYATLGAAVKDAEENDVIDVVNNIETAETIVILEDKNITISLGENIITGTMHKNVGGVIKNLGVLNLNGGTVKSAANNGGSAIVNAGTLTVTGTTLNGAPNADGSWPSYTVNNTGSLTITDANITSYHGAVASYNEGAIVELNNTNIDMTGIPGFTNHAIYTYNNGKVVVNGGNIANNATDQSSTGGSVINGAVEVNDGNFSGRIENYYGTPVIKGGTFTVNPKKFVAEGYKFVEEEGKWIVIDNSWIAKINEVPYTSLKAAIEAVQDGETITLVDNEKFTKDNRTHNSSTWYDGIYYVGDKNFTIDLNGKTISQDGSVNDYMLNFKNDGEKANTIILKNGTVDAGTTAFCALCTSSGSTQELTINLEDINLINNIANGSTVKLRGGAVLNVKEGTVITGKNSYLGIESVASTVNIYDGAEIYMNGTSSYNGCLVGACGNGIVNVYGGKGIGVKGGFIAMTSGGTINIEGGEWTANNDGTIGNNSNLYVLTSQNNNKESGYVGASIINVSGGTFRGGMDAWILNPGTTPKENAELNISGGCFNANPSSYLAEGFVAEKNETTGLWTIVELGYTKAENGDITVKSLVGLKNALTMAGAAGAGDTNIILSGNMDMTGVEWTPITVDGYNGADIVTLDGNNATIKGLTAPLFAGGFAGGSGIVIKNLTIDASTIVSTNTTGSGAFVESSDSQSKVELVNCHLKNSSVTGSRTGGLVGWTSGYNNVNDGPVKSYITLENCSVTNCTITGSSVGGLNGHAGANAWTYTTIKDCTVTGCTLNSTDDGGWRVGVAVGTANVGEVTITNLTEYGNTLTQTGKTAPTGDKRNYYGRFVPGESGKLVIDGVQLQLVSTLSGL